MQTIMNKSDVTGNRKELRNHSTSAEATLWKMLKGKQIAGLKFRRQHSYFLNRVEDIEVLRFENRTVF